MEYGIWQYCQTCKEEIEAAMTSNKMFQVVWQFETLGFHSKPLKKKKI